MLNLLPELAMLLFRSVYILQTKNCRQLECCQDPVFSQRDGGDGSSRGDGGDGSSHGDGGSVSSSSGGGMR